MLNADNGARLVGGNHRRRGQLVDHGARPLNRTKQAVGTTPVPNACLRAHMCMGYVCGVPLSEFNAASELLKVLSSPVRLAIITRLAAGPAAVHELGEVTGQAQPLVSQHLRVLRSVHLIQVTTRGRERVYELVDDHVAHIVSDAIRHTAEQR